MKLNRLLYVLFFPNLIFCEILHDPISSAIYGEPLIVKTVITEKKQDIKRVELFYKSSNKEHFYNVEMNNDFGPNYYFEIDKELVKEGILYFILVDLGREQIKTFPNEDPFNNPISVVTDKPSELFGGIDEDSLEFTGPSSNAIILSPLPNETIDYKDIVISLSLFHNNDFLVDSTQIFIDEVNFSNSIDIYNNYLICRPQLEIGQHIVKIIFYDSNGNSYRPVRWKFKVAKLTKSNVRNIESGVGRVTFNSGRNQINNTNINYSRFNLSLNQNYNWMEGRFAASKSYNKSINNITKFSQFDFTNDRYTIEFKNNILKLLSGDIYPVFNKYALNGYRVRGTWINLDAKYISFDILSGILNDGYDGDKLGSMIISDYNFEASSLEDAGLLSDDSEALDTIIISRDNYQFKRNITAIKMSVSLPKKTAWDLAIVKAIDNKESVQPILSDSEIYIPETLSNINDNETIKFNQIESLFPKEEYYIDIAKDQWAGEKPKDNLILSSDLRMDFEDGKIKFKTGFSFSLLNRNTWSPVLTKQELDTLSFLGDSDLDEKIAGKIDINFNPSDFENSFQMGLEQVPLIPIDLQSSSNPLKSILHMPSLSFYYNFKFQYSNHLINFGYNQVGPEYNSLANPFIEQNIREYFINDRFSLLDDKLFIFINWKTSNDNIIEKEIISTKNSFDSQFNLLLGPGTPIISLNYGTKKNDNGILESEIIDFSEYLPERTIYQKMSFSISDNFYLYGYNHNINFNVFNAELNDMVYDEGYISNDIDYFSKRSLVKNNSISLLSQISKKWSSNVQLGTNYFDFSEEPYFKKQKINDLHISANYKLESILEMIRFGTNFASTTNNYNLNNNLYGIFTDITVTLMKKINFKTNLQIQKRIYENSNVSNNFMFTLYANYKF